MKFIHSYLFVVLTSLSFGLFGQTTVTVGTGTSTDYNFPIQPYFNYGWTSQIYTSAEIGTSGVLNSIAFYINNSSGSYTLDNQKIYMRQTSASQHVDKNYPGTTGFTLVYSGSITIGASGWKTITLTTPFTYSNSSNLEILIESRDGSTFTSAVQTRYTSKSEYRTKYDYNDYAFPTTWYAGGRVTKLPNIQFVINTCTAVAGSVSTTTSTICAGNTASLTLNGQTAGQNIQWQESTDNLTFTDIIGASSTTSTTFTTPALTSIKYYRAKVGSGSCIVYSNVQTISVTALPATPTSTNNGPLCAGSTLNLTASTITGATYAWTGPNSFTSTSQNPSIATITTAGAGTYSVTATVNGCTSVAGTTSVTVNNYPTNVSISASATTVTSGTSVTLTASGATNYNWDNGLGTGAVKTVTPTSSTTYTVIADNGNSCKDTTSITIDVTNSSNTGVTTSTVTIGTGTATDYSIPLQSYFNYGWSSQLYLASELQGGGFLNSLSFYVTNSGASYTLDNQKIYVRHTTDASFADKNYPGTTGFTLVYDGPITISSTGWKTIPFSTPFNYNGTSNLEVLVESRDGSTFTSAIQTRYTNQSGTSIYRTKYDYNNDAFPSTYYQGGRNHHYANIQFNKTVCNLPTPVILSLDTLCQGAKFTLKTDTVSNATYTWTGPNGFFSNTQNPIVTDSVLVQFSGNYNLKITIGSCEKNVSKKMTILTNPQVSTVDSLSVCNGDELTLGVNTISNYKYRWVGNLDLQCDTCSSNLLYLDSNSRYELQIIKNNGCITLNTYLINVKNTPSVSYSLESNKSLNSTIIRFESDEVIQLKNLTDGKIFNGDNNSFTLNPIADTKYYYKASNEFGCKVSDTIFISGNPFNINVKVIQPTENSQGVIILSPQSGKGPFKYVWNDEYEIDPLLLNDKKIKEGSKRFGLTPGFYDVQITDSLNDTLNYHFVLANQINWLPNNNIELNGNKVKLLSQNGDNNLISLDLIKSNLKSFISQEITSTKGNYSFGITSVSDTVIKDSIDTIQFGYVVNNSQLSIIVDGQVTQINDLEQGENINLSIINGSLKFIRNDQILYEYPVGLVQKYLTTLRLNTPEVIDNLTFYSSNTALSSIIVNKTIGNQTFSQKPSLEFVVDSLVKSEINWKMPSGEIIDTSKIENLTPGNYQLTVKENTYTLNDKGTLTPIFTINTLNYLIGEVPSLSVEKNLSLINQNNILKSLNTTDSYAESNAYFNDVFENQKSSWISFQVSTLSEQESVFSLTSDTTSNDNFKFKFFKTISNQNTVKIYEGDNEVFTTTFNELDRFSIEKLGTSIRFYQNGTIIKNITSQFSSQSLRPVFRLRSPGGGFTSIYSSLNNNEYNAPIKYSMLRKTIEGTVYKTNKSKIYFKYKEEYGSNKITCKLRPNLSDAIYLTTFNTEIGDNFLVIDMCYVADFIGYGILEVVNSKNESYFVRFFRNISEQSDCLEVADDMGNNKYHSPSYSF